MACK
jgi:hypothetical protein